MNTVCISTKMSTPEKVRETKHRASPPLQKVGGHVPLSTHGFTSIPLAIPLDVSAVHVTW